MGSHPEDGRHAIGSTFDHVGVTVADLNTVTAFFLGLRGPEGIILSLAERIG
jgi:hypothetical protein